MTIYLNLLTATLWAATVIWLAHKQSTDAYVLFAKLTSRMDDHEKVMMTLRREVLNTTRDHSRIMAKLGEVEKPVKRWLKDEKINPELYDD
jgi:hypothetical protein